MIALYIILSLILLIFLIGFIPLSIRLKYYDQLEVYIPVLFLKIKIMPRNKNIKGMSQSDFEKRIALDKRKQEKKKIKEEKKQLSTKKQDKKIPIRNVLSSLDDIVLAAKSIISKFSSFLFIKIYSLNIVIATGDASKTAVQYGSVCAGVSFLLELLDTNSNLKYSRENISVNCDFLGEKSVVNVDIKFRIRFYQLLRIAINALLSFIKIKNKLEVRENA